MPERTEEEWRQLIAALLKIVTDSAESPSRRAKAQGILDSIERPKLSAYHPDGPVIHRGKGPLKPHTERPQGLQEQYDYDERFDGRIV